ncbi:MAG: hypothetical protein AAGI23_04340 [Bacteroidota bacterium]
MNFIHLISALTGLSPTTDTTMKKKTTSTRLSQKLIQDVRCVKSEVIFGSPRNRCKGTGICKVLTLSAGQQPTRTLTYVTLEKNGKLRFDFVKDSMSADLIDFHFHNHLFMVTDDFYFPKPMLKALGVEELSIQPGFYQVAESGQFLSIYFS